MIKKIIMSYCNIPSQYRRNRGGHVPPTFPKIAFVT